MLSFLLTVVILGTLGATALAGVPQIAISAGIVEGGRCTGTSDAVYYKSIPYAQPPIGDLRFAPPQPYSGKFPSGTLSATSSAPACIQFGTLFVETEATSEDCLYLDIWSPPNATNSSALPVKVFIYGGYDTAGGISNVLYDGCNLAKDAIIVSINYRLGPLGFLAFDSGGIQGNQAIQDLLIGLEWVQSNIAAFGGDPEKVLMFGQSAGAINTFIIATLPQAPSLMNAAITESGGGRDVELNSSAQSLGATYAAALGCTLGDVACLKSKSVSELKMAFTNLPALHSGIGIDGVIGADNAKTLEFAAHLDGTIIQAQPSDEGVRVPTIFGSNANEGALFTLSQFAAAPDGPASVTAENYTTFLQDSFGSAAAFVEEYFPLSTFNSSPFPAFTAISTVLSDSTYKCSAYRGLNRAVEKNIPVWTYLFSHTPPCSWLSVLPQQAVPLVGATHTAELPYVFGNLLGLPAPNGTCNSTSSADIAISEFIIGAWTSMAANGDPSRDGISWPAYGGPLKSLGINFNNSTSAGAINYTVCEFWDQVDQMTLNSTSSGNSTGISNSTAPAVKSGAPEMVLDATIWTVLGITLGATCFV